MKLLLVTILGFLTASTSNGQLRIPHRELGFVYNNGQADAPVKLAAYIDLTCPYSKQAFRTLLYVAEYFGTSQLQLKVHLFSLPYHRHSHTISKGAHVLSAYKSPLNATVYDWISFVYSNIDSLTTAATVNQTDIEVLSFLANLANQVSGISTADFETGVSMGFSLFLLLESQSEKNSSTPNAISFTSGRVGRSCTLMQINAQKDI